MTNSENLAYIRGLGDGLGIDDSTKEGKVITAIVDLLDELCLSVDELEDSYDELQGQVDEIDEDLGSLEEDFYEIDEDDCDCGCGHHDCHCHDDDEDDGFEDDDCYFEVTCPVCGDTIELNSAMLDEGSIDCPNCGETLEFDLDEIEEECECGCCEE